MVAVIVIKQWFFCSQVSQGDGTDNSDNRKTSQDPKWWHAENSNFKITDIYFYFFVHLMLSYNNIYVNKFEVYGIFSTI